MRELAAPLMNQQPLYIICSDLDVHFEVKSGLIHLLPKSRSLENENSHKHLKEFHVVCLSMKPHGIYEEQIKLRVFPFLLDDAANEWLFYLDLDSIITWLRLLYNFLIDFPTS